MNKVALDWSNRQKCIYQKANAGVPRDIHYDSCAKEMRILEILLLFYLYPERKISFDGFVNYEGCYFGVSYSYCGSTAQIMWKNDTIYIYSTDLKKLLTTHDATWRKRDRLCAD